MPSAAVCGLLFLLLVGAAPAHALEMKAGAAKAVITPDLDKARISVFGKALEGVSHDIYTRVLVLNDGAHRLVIVVNDLNCLDVATPILRKRCRDELGIDAAYLIPLATHNHNAPIQIVPDNFDYGRRLADQIFDVIQNAIADEQGPVKIQFGSGYGYFVKSLGNAPTDYESQLLKVTRGDAVVALLFNCPTHPMQEAANKVEPGHPGYAVEIIEQRLPGALAMYCDACGGNQFPAKGMKGAREAVKTFGREVAATALAIADKPLEDVTGPIRSRFGTISLPLAKPIPREEALKLSRFAALAPGFVPYPDPRRDMNWIRALLKHYEQGIPFPTKSTDLVCTDDAFLVQDYETPRDFPCRFEETIVARIGLLLFVAMQGEVCAPIGMRIKDAFRCNRPIMVSAYMGEHNLYIPTREIVRVGIYQAKVIQTQYASPVGWAPQVEDEMVGGVIRMVNEVIQEK
jgi:hypothetical protein